jgi:4-aminobutyrate aminotransferase-like enzyme
MQRLEAWCREAGALFIVDEVQASFGRTGTMFCFEQFGVTPNLLCLGKGISSSVPVAAVMGEARVMDVLEPGTMSSTHGGNAFCSRVALENLSIIVDEHLVDNAARQGAYFARRFTAMEERFAHLGQARGLGLVWGLEIVADRAAKTPDPELTRRIVHRCYEKGLLLIAPIGMYGNVIRIAPPLVITEEQSKIGLDILEGVFAEIG